jgi:hypothetical protein
MKTLNIPLEDKEHKALSKVKGNKTWREFLLKLIDENKGGKEKKNE